MYITLVVASNTIPYSNKVEARFVEYVVVSSSNLKQAFGKAVIEVLLLCGVVQSRMFEVFGAISNEEFLELRKVSFKATYVSATITTKQIRHKA